MPALWQQTSASTSPTRFLPLAVFPWLPQTPLRSYLHAIDLLRPDNSISSNPICGGWHGSLYILLHSAGPTCCVRSGILASLTRNPYLCLQLCSFGGYVLKPLSGDLQLETTTAEYPRWGTWRSILRKQASRLSILLVPIIWVRVFCHARYRVQRLLYTNCYVSLAGPILLRLLRPLSADSTFPARSECRCCQPSSSSVLLAEGLGSHVAINLQINLA